MVVFRDKALLCVVTYVLYSEIYSLYIYIFFFQNIYYPAFCSLWLCHIFCLLLHQPSIIKKKYHFLLTFQCFSLNQHPHIREKEEKYDAGRTHKFKDQVQPALSVPFVIFCFQAARRGDSNLYTCHAINKFGQIQSHGELRVYSKSRK